MMCMQIMVMDTFLIKMPPSWRRLQGITQLPIYTFRTCIRHLIPTPCDIHLTYWSQRHHQTRSMVFDLKGKRHQFVQMQKIFSSEYIFGQDDARTYTTHETSCWVRSCLNPQTSDEHNDVGLIDWCQPRRMKSLVIKVWIEDIDKLSSAKVHENDRPLADAPALRSCSSLQSLEQFTTTHYVPWTAFRGQ